MSGVIDVRREELERQRGEPFLTAQEAAKELGVTRQAIYHSKDKYGVVEHEGYVFVPMSVVDPCIEPIEIRGVEHQEHVGRVGVTRYLCLPCRRYFRTREVADTHGCFRRAVFRGE